MEGKIFQEKPVLLMSATPGKNGGRTNLEHMERLMPWWGGTVVGTFSLARFPENFDAEAGDLRDEARRGELAASVKALEAAVS